MSSKSIVFAKERFIFLPMVHNNQTTLSPVLLPMICLNRPESIDIWQVRAFCVHEAPDDIRVVS